jgi:streptogramin lyase
MTGRILVVAVLLVLIACSLLPPRRTPRALALPHPTTTVMWGSTLAVLIAGWFVMNQKWLQRKTVLAQRQQWILSPPLRQPGGIAYLNGSLLLADYGKRAIYRLDLRTGAYAEFWAQSVGGRLRYVRPTDIAVGPRGRLYVLNNGPGHGALFIMLPTGQLLRQLSLDGTTTQAHGIAVDARGGLYVADTVGGRVWRYGPSGGAPTTSWGGVDHIFNNVTGVAVGRDGMVYAAESSAQRVQQLDSAGDVVRTYELDCTPRKLVLDAGWVEVACTDQVVSINPRSGATQLVRLRSQDPPLTAPLALAAGGRGTLYVLDANGRIAAFDVRH